MKEIFKNPRVLISALFFIVILYQLKDSNLFQSTTTLIVLFVIAPLVISLFVKYLFNKKG